MDLSEYQAIRSYEDSHWWYVATHRAVMREHGKLRNNAFVLDAGCGTGGMLEILRGSFDVAGFDSSFLAVQSASRRDGCSKSVATGNIHSIFFRDNCFDAVTCIDVIYHAGVKDERIALREIHRVLKPGGCLVLQVPAFECLRGGHDEAVHTRKRYRAEEVRLLLEQAGFRVSKLLYRFPWLFLPALVIRKLSRGSGKSDLRPVSPALNSLLAFLAWLSDSSVAPELPFGTSLFAVAVKKP